MFVHNLNPVLLDLGFIQIHWYGMMYFLSFVFGFLYMLKSKHFGKLKLSKTKCEDLLFYIILGVLLGGRLGYILFYNLALYLDDPLKIFRVWEGGMSFHGGVIGVILGVLYFASKNKIKFFKLIDGVILFIPISLFLGRIGNFINGELFGRITDSPICMYFPADPENCRYPSQLFEAFLEGIVLFLILYWLSRKNLKAGVLSSVFLGLYSIFRFIVEFYREPDEQIGLYFDAISQGQVLSLVLIIVSVGLLLYLQKRNNGSLHG